MPELQTAIWLVVSCCGWPDYLTPAWMTRVIILIVLLALHNLLRGSKVHFGASLGCSAKFYRWICFHETCCLVFGGGLDFLKCCLKLGTLCKESLNCSICFLDYAEGNALLHKHYIWDCTSKHCRKCLELEALYCRSVYHLSIYLIGGVMLYIALMR